MDPRSDLPGGIRRPSSFWSAPVDLDAEGGTLEHWSRASTPIQDLQQSPFEALRQDGDTPSLLSFDATALAHELLLPDDLTRMILARFGSFSPDSSASAPDDSFY